MTLERYSFEGVDAGVGEEMAEGFVVAVRGAKWGP